MRELQPRHESPTTWLGWARGGRQRGRQSHGRQKAPHDWEPKQPPQHFAFKSQAVFQEVPETALVWKFKYPRNREKSRIYPFRNQNMT